MAGACLLIGAMVISLTGDDFALHWTHSVEKTEWVEVWRVEGEAMIMTEARVKGSGAGMEPGEGAHLQDGWWVWAPETRVQVLHLAASGATGQGWRLCDGDICREIGARAGEALTLAPCAS